MSLPSAQPPPGRMQPLLPFRGCCSVPLRYPPCTPAWPWLRLPRQPWLLSSGKGFLVAGQSGFLTMSSNSPRRLRCAAHPKAAPGPASPSPAARTVPAAGMGQVARPTLPGPEGCCPTSSPRSQAGVCWEGCRPLGSGPSCGGEGLHVSGSGGFSPHERKARCLDEDGD